MYTLNGRKICNGCLLFTIYSQPYSQIGMYKDPYNSYLIQHIDRKGSRKYGMQKKNKQRGKIKVKIEREIHFCVEQF